MANLLSALFKRILKAAKADRFYYFLRSNFYINKVAVPVGKDLSTLRPLQHSPAQTGIDLVTITPRSLLLNPKTSQSLIYPDEQRLKTAMAYLGKGYRGVALVCGNEVLGDIWYTDASTHENGAVHPDLKWLRVSCGENEVYAFDMYVYPGRRGNNIANMLQNGALHEIRRNGYSRALGYFWADNIPALWVHRTLKWNELKRVKVTRLFHYYYSHDSCACIGK
jgi:GNAT superfamily N-acetyltransferase